MPKQAELARHARAISSDLLAKSRELRAAVQENIWTARRIRALVTWQRLLRRISG
jgi:hypothetical protein